MSWGVDYRSLLFQRVLSHSAATALTVEQVLTPFQLDTEPSADTCNTGECSSGPGRSQQDLKDSTPQGLYACMCTDRVCQLQSYQEVKYVSLETGDKIITEAKPVIVGSIQ